jgi:ElaB/YqjD/DUF883 family membrane-anchored ribosome-binding protein
MFGNKTTEFPSPLADQAAASADHAIRSTQRIANQALDGLAGSMQDLQQQATPMVDRAADRVSAMAHHGADAVRDRSQQFSDGVHRMTEGTRGYVQEEPLKSLLIAAAAGAALMALWSFLGGSRRPG